MRFLIAGALLAGLVLLMAGGCPRGARDWGMLAVVGLFLLLGGNAVVVWAEQFVESGPASVFVAAVPLWAAFFDAMVPGGSTVFTWRVGVGLALGFFGSALLAGMSPHRPARRRSQGADRPHPRERVLGPGLASTASGARPRARPYAASAVQMLAGGAAITLLGLLGGEAADWHTDRRGLGALAYLVVFGSIVGFTAFAYALRHASATVVGTYAYVNPVVAVLLGWLVLGEPVTGRMLAAMVLILGAVLMIQLGPQAGAVAGGHGHRSRSRRTA